MEIPSRFAKVMILLSFLFLVNKQKRIFIDNEGWRIVFKLDNNGRRVQQHRVPMPAPVQDREWEVHVGRLFQG